MIVVDASAVIEFLLQTDAAAPIAERLLQEGRRVHAPQLMDLEVLQAFRRLVLAREVTQDRAGAAVARLITCGIRRWPHRSLRTRVWELRHNLTAYDATYVALAERLGCTVLTRDAKLARAPGLKRRVELI
ncbi:MAG: type II toxin-antitoxin system VapC family toxin [Planctomycetes bacterium]|nr:type II toxin-antitoxin system VapC family toxin [Planctomycetota bacterium]